MSLDEERGDVVIRGALEEEEESKEEEEEEEEQNSTCHPLHTHEYTWRKRL